MYLNYSYKGEGNACCVKSLQQGMGKWPYWNGLINIMRITGNNLKLDQIKLHKYKRDEINPSLLNKLIVNQL